MILENITIIIVTYASDKKIISCLDSIDKSVKVIIIENSQNLKLKESLEARYSNLDCLIPEENLGYSKANNLGLNRVKTKYALILNPDTLLKKNTLNNFLQTAKKYPDFYLIGPINDQGKNFKKNIDNKIFEVKNLKGFAIFFNMEKFKDKEFFDDNYFLYFEEMDLCRTIKLKHNGKIFIDPNIKIIHEGASSVADNYIEEIEKNRNWHWMWSTFYYHKKFNNFFYALILISPNLFTSIFRVVFYFMIKNKKKKIIYYQRLSGIINSILGKNSWHRPSLD